MKLYYKAVSEDGKTVHGEIEAKDPQEAAVYLRSNKLLPVKITHEKEKTLKEILSFGQRQGANDLVFFTRQLSSMLTSGLTLMQALLIMKNQFPNPKMAGVVEGISQSVSEGSSFSEAIKKYPDVFSPIYISLIKAAESSGLLDKVLLRMADNLEKQAKLKGTIRSALLYPAIVVSLMVVVVIIMMIFVIPQLTALYQNINIPLPLPTQIIVGLSNSVILFWPFILAFLAISFFYYKRWHKTEAGKLAVDALLLRLPIFGKLIKESLLTEFTRTFGLLVGTGSLVVDSLLKSADTVSNVLYKKAIMDVSRRVEKGVSIGDAFSYSPLFPAIVVEMVKIGEQTGKLDDSLTRVSEYFEREVEQTVKGLTTAMEPIIMIVLAIGVGFLIISIITPIYNLISSIQ